MQNFQTLNIWIHARVNKWVLHTRFYLSININNFGLILQNIIKSVTHITFKGGGLANDKLLWHHIQTFGLGEWEDTQQALLKTSRLRYENSTFGPSVYEAGVPRTQPWCSGLFVKHRTNKLGILKGQKTISHPKGGTKIESIWEQCAVENIISDRGFKDNTHIKKISKWGAS
jgi:hypothetical protein